MNRVNRVKSTDAGQGSVDRRFSDANFSKSFFNARFWSVIVFVFCAAAMRLIPHPPNFTPIAAMALFGGAMFKNRTFAFAVPLLAMFVSDLFLGFHSQMLSVYSAFLVIAAVGIYLQSFRSVARVGGIAIVSSMVFFLITNFAVWAQGAMYPMSANGLIASYVAGLPFFGNALAGDLFFTAVIFGAWAAAERLAPQLRTEVEAAAL